MKCEQVELRQEVWLLSVDASNLKKDEASLFIEREAYNVMSENWTMDRWLHLRLFRLIYHTSPVL